MSLSNMEWLEALCAHINEKSGRNFKIIVVKPSMWSMSSPKYKLIHDKDESVVYESVNVSRVAAYLSGMYDGLRITLSDEVFNKKVDDKINDFLTDKKEQELIDRYQQYRENKNG